MQKAQKPRHFCLQVSSSLCAVEELRLCLFAFKAQRQQKVCRVQCYWKAKQGSALPSPEHKKVVGHKSWVQPFRRMVSSIKDRSYSENASSPARFSCLCRKAGQALNKVAWLIMERYSFQSSVKRYQPEVQRLYKRMVQAHNKTLVRTFTSLRFVLAAQLGR